MWPDEMDLSGLPARRNRCDQDGGEQRWDTSLHTDLHAREHEHEACLSKALSKRDDLCLWREHSCSSAQIGSTDTIVHCMQRNRPGCLARNRCCERSSVLRT